MIVSSLWIFCHMLNVIQVEGNVPCGKDSFTCIYSKECVKLQYICDGVRDCQDNTDEEHCPEVTKTHQRRDSQKNKKSKTKKAPEPGDPDWMCPYNLFTCKNKECIAKTLRCDGVPHCSDKSDEANCPKDKTNNNYPTEEVGDDFQCPHGLFTCQNKECVVPTEICNGTPLCSDGSDEWDCKYSNTKGKVNKRKSKTEPTKDKPVKKKSKLKSDRDAQSPKQKKDKARTKRNTKVNPQKSGKDYSKGGKDDIVNMCNRNPKGQHRKPNIQQQFAFKDFFQCADGMFTCDNGQCISDQKRCNGHKECHDGSDESNCVITDGVIADGRNAKTKTRCGIKSGVACKSKDSSKFDNNRNNEENQTANKQNLGQHLNYVDKFVGDMVEDGDILEGKLDALKRKRPKPQSQKSAVQIKDKPNRLTDLLDGEEHFRDEL